MNMFPSSITSDLTLYIPWTDPNHPTVRVVERAILKGIFWNEDSDSIFRDTGVQVVGQVRVFIPYDNNITGREWIEPIEWNKIMLSAELADYYTADLRQAQNTRLVRGVCDFEFQIAGNKYITAAQLSQLQAQFDHPQSGIIGAKRPTDVIVQNFGTTGQHIQIRCR
jgi:hypothetical protein